MLGLSDTKYILPSASSRPISLNRGASMPGWSDIQGLDLNAPEDKDGFVSSASRVNALIQSEIDKGISPSRICVAGFSQGPFIDL